MWTIPYSVDALPLSACAEREREGEGLRAEGVEKSKCFWRLSGGREVNQLTTRREERKGHDAVS